MQKITPFLWFNDNAAAAIDFYKSVFKDFELVKTTKYGDGGPMPKGTLMTAEFKMFGHHYVALNGGPHFSFNEAISFVVNCESQEEVDYYWDRLTEGGTESQCGWLKDQFGLSWQVVPTALPKLLAKSDPEAVNRVLQAMFKMKKIVIADLENAAAEVAV